MRSDNPYDCQLCGLLQVKLLSYLILPDLYLYTVAINHIVCSCTYLQLLSEFTYGITDYIIISIEMLHKVLTNKINGGLV